MTQLDHATRQQIVGTIPSPDAIAEPVIVVCPGADSADLDRYLREQHPRRTLVGHVRVPA